MQRVQTEDFDLAREYNALRQPSSDTSQDTSKGKGQTSGAVVTFTGLVREFTTAQLNATLELQHYPGMTEKVLNAIEEQARKRWPLHAVSIIHRVGKLAPGDQIVFVGVSSQHRSDAFEAAQYIMDILKTQAPFWKKEGDKWLNAKSSDQQAAQRWLNRHSVD